MILIDENLSYKLAAKINVYFKGAKAVSKIPELGEGSSDQNIWDFAKENGLALLTISLFTAALLAKVWVLAEA